jgi:hypothetical protein
MLDNEFRFFRIPILQMEPISLPYPVMPVTALPAGKMYIACAERLERHWRRVDCRGELARSSVPFAI